MVSEYLLRPSIWDNEGTLRYYFEGNGSRFMQLGIEGLEVLPTSIPVNGVDYDEYNRPRITGIDMI